MSAFGSERPLVLIPLYNSREWCEKCELLPEFDYLASDNCSSDGSADVLEKRGVQVLRQNENLGRIGNWRACLTAFLQSKATWMKWLFTGDSFEKSLFTTVRKALESHPDARFISTGYWEQEAGKREPRQSLLETTLVASQTAMELAAEKGNWFGPPTSLWIHRDALAEGFDLGRMEFLADMQLALDIAKRHPTLYVAEPLVTFDLSARTFHRANSETQLARLEHAVMRHQAARSYLDLSENRSEYERLVLQIERDAEFAILERAGLNRKALSDLEHILKLIPARRLPALALRRFFSGMGKRA